MDQPNSDLRLSRIDTLWNEVQQAHLDGTLAAGARRGLLIRYGGAVRRYLLAATRDSEAAEDLFQEFAVIFLRGGLRGADPDRGRFRDYVKGVLFHLVASFHKKGKKRPLPLVEDPAEPVVEPDSEQEQAFLASWRDELLARAWVALKEQEAETGQLFFTVLRFRADHPDASSQQMADDLSRLLGKDLTAPGVRQTLHRARQAFAGLLLDEISHALTRPTPESLEEELIELGLLEHCRSALQRRADQR
jgi:RNA polymerase sigma-70 factor (ECF subfamily)